MAASKLPPFRTNPSTIARYFFHDCERFLYFSAADPKRRRRQGIPEPAFDHGPVVKAILASGFRWEEEVVGRILHGRVVVAAGEGDLHTRRLPLEQTLRCLRTEPAGRFLYQPTLAPPPRFYEQFGIDPRLVTISNNHPDLIAILPDGAGGRLFRVVDVKRGDTLKLTRRVQVLLYALELGALLREEGIPAAAVDLDHGGVWLGRQPEPELFSLADFRPHREKFLREDLGRVLAASAREAQWHLYPRCEWCEFFDHCRQEMRQADDLSRLERLTMHGKRHLREEAGVQTLTELGRFLRRPNADAVLDRCASLAGQRHRLAVRVSALETGQPQLHGAASPDLPRGEHIGLFLTLQQEPLGQAVYLPDRVPGRTPAPGPPLQRRTAPVAGPAYLASLHPHRGRPPSALQSPARRLAGAGPGGKGHDAHVPFPGSGIAAGRPPPRQRGGLPGRGPAKRGEPAACPAGRGQLHPARDARRPRQRVRLPPQGLLPLSAGPRAAGRGDPRRVVPGQGREPGGDRTAGPATPPRGASIVAAGARAGGRLPGGLAAEVSAPHWGGDSRPAPVAPDLLRPLRKQVRVPEAAIPVHLLAEGGRLVLAGDHFQLPPIIAGTYPDTPPGEPLLHRSIFEAVYPRDGRDSRLLRPLLENFRMNDVLTSFAAALLYGPGYRCVDRTVADRRLAFRAGRGLDPLVGACLDPDFPLVLVILDGIRAAQANEVEADLVAQLVTGLRAGLRAADDRPYADDAAFFRHGVFVVSPHHAQIRAIRQELAKYRRWKAAPFVDTVDKMQGQEADAVVVSYGVADPEFALKEAEFIYGLNRLNVAVTRARVKSIVCLPRPLLEATPQVLDVEAAAAGLAFMRRLVATAERAGETLSFEGDEVEARVLRVGRPLAGAAAADPTPITAGAKKPVRRKTPAGRRPADGHQKA